MMTDGASKSNTYACHYGGGKGHNGSSFLMRDSRYVAFLSRYKRVCELMVIGGNWVGRYELRRKQ